MPRSNDGRWTAQCKLCGKPFGQRKKSQEYCSQACSNKAFPGTGGRKPARGVEPRACVVCEKQFQPYRASQETCSPECRRRSPRFQEIQRRSDRRPERQARRNDLRRGKAVTAATNRRNQLRRYGITVEEYEAKLLAQGGVCIICGLPPKSNGVRAASRLHNDHDHKTGQNRDLLCLNCNQGLGCFKDDPGLMRAAAEYVERHRALV